MGKKILENLPEKIKLRFFFSGGDDQGKERLCVLFLINFY